jgi:hypothetical protein
VEDHQIQLSLFAQPGLIAKRMQTRPDTSNLHVAKILIVLFSVAAWAAPGGKDKSAAASNIRWSEGKPGCTFTRGEDGKYRYGLWSDDLGITLAVDHQALQLSRRRLRPFIGILLTLRYKGPNRLELRNDNISLEFVTHSHLVQRSLNPGDFSAQYQNDVDDLIVEKEREIKKHPDREEQIETVLQAYQKELVEMQEFLRTRSLRPVRLDPETPETNGWVFFSAKSKWIGDWKKREDFVLRIPVENRLFEFPFSLPPAEGDLILRRRPEN